MFEAETYEGAKLCWSGDLVINTMWAWMAALGVSAHHGIVSPSYGVYRLNDPNVFEPRFLDLLLRTAQYTAEYFCRSTGIRHSRLRLYPEEFLKIPLPCPPIQEQKSILEFLDAKLEQIDRFITNKRHLIELLEEEQVSVVADIICDRGSNTTRQEMPVDWADTIPSHWQIKRVKNLAAILRGKFTHRPRNDPQMYDGKYPFIQTGDVARAKKYVTKYSQTLNDLGYTVSKEFPKGTLCMTIAANIGDMAILDFDACFPDSIVGLVPMPDVDLEFLYYFMICMKQDMLRTAPISTQMNLNVDRVGALLAFQPPIDEQRSIVAKIEKELNSLREVTERAEQEIDLMNEFRTSLIAEAVTGKIDLQGE